MTYNARIKATSFVLWLVLVLIISPCWHLVLSSVSVPWAQAVLVLLCYGGTLAAAIGMHGLVEHALLNSRVKWGLGLLAPNTRSLDDVYLNLLLKLGEETAECLREMEKTRGRLQPLRELYKPRPLLDVAARSGCGQGSAESIGELLHKAVAALVVCDAGTPVQHERNWIVYQFDPVTSYHGFLYIRRGGTSKIGRQGRIGKRAFRAAYASREATLA